MQILIVGGGNMGLTYTSSFIKSKIVNRDQVMILEKSHETIQKLKSLNIGSIYEKAGDFIKTADLIILAIKPIHYIQVLEDISSYLEPNQVILSIMAGVKIASISPHVPTDKIVRVMPNLPVQIGEGMSVFTALEAVTRIELVAIQNLLNSTGRTLYVEDENLIDASTAVSGSGPAYVFYFMKSMIEKAIQFGFSSSEAEMIVYQTFSGAVESYNKADISCDEWIERVTSKRGTTEAAMKSFENDKISTKISDGMENAYQRAKEISEGKF